MNKYNRFTRKMISRREILILCCGKSEHSYFNFIKKHFKYKPQNVTIEILCSKQNISMPMVEQAINNKEKYFETWVVFDRDKDTEFDKAIIKAINSGIRVAFSNVAFEYWLLLHLTDKSGIIPVSELNRDLTRLLGYEYNKNRNMERVCKDIMKDITKAEDRAKLRHEEHKKDPSKKYSDWCSCTTVYELTKRLREWESIAGM